MRPFWFSNSMLQRSNLYYFVFLPEPLAHFGLNFLVDSNLSFPLLMWQSSVGPDRSDRDLKPTDNCKIKTCVSKPGNSSKCCWFHLMSSLFLLMNIWWNLTWILLSLGGSTIPYFVMKPRHSFIPNFTNLPFADFAGRIGVDMLGRSQSNQVWIIYSELSNITQILDHFTPLQLTASIW